MKDIAGRQAQQISDEKYAVGTEWERTSKVYVRDCVPAAPPQLTVLDIGCGTGLNARHLADKGHKVVGVDISPVAIEKFKAQGFEGMACDITAGLPFEDGQFDLVFAAEVIEHVADTEAFLAEAFRVLRPSGRLVLSTVNSAFWVFRVLGVLGQTLSEIQHPGHIRFFSIHGLRNSVGEAGFTDIIVSGRNMYMVLGDAIGQALAPLLRRLGFVREYRFRTGTHFWQLSRYAKTASPLWTDTQIVTAGKPADRHAV